MAYDAARENVVLLAPEGTTWTWDGSTWTERFPTESPPASGEAAMAYDAATSSVVLFGGDLLAETWTWDGTDWVRMEPASRPPWRDALSMALRRRRAPSHPLRGTRLLSDSVVRRYLGLGRCQLGECLSVRTGLARKAEVSRIWLHGAAIGFITPSRPPWRSRPLSAGLW
jgi:hypothetical protein